MNTKQPSGQKNKAPINIRAVFDVIMGFIYAGVGSVLALSKMLNIKLAFIEPAFVVIFGICCILYGGFRVYRGVKTWKQPL
ncbi:MAG: hypothetical protein ACK4E8_10140 [Lacibacter sp.]